MSGTYVFDTLNVNGCDSTMYLNLIINNSQFDTISIDTCNEFLWNGFTYSQSGILYRYSNKYV